MAIGPVQEVRFAIVLYGGVSLAIYINGVVQELLRLVRSTVVGSTASLPELEFSEKVYRRLGCLLEPGGLPTKPADSGPNAEVKTRFKVDIISGTSAGGINGIFLAKALASEGCLNELENLWFDEGDIEKLLNDQKSCSGLPIKRQTVPQSLLNSQRMYLKLLRALAGR
jgi:patatin-related protein